MRYLYFALIVMLMHSCKQEVKQAETKPATVELEAKTEALIRGFSVKDSAGIMVKDSLRGMQSVTFSETDKEVSNIFYNLDGTIAWEDRYVYNDKGFKSGSKYYENGKHLITYKYDLDSLGRRVGYVALESSTAVEMYKGFSKFENDGKLRKDGTPGASGIVQWNYEYMFDDKGEETGYVFIAPNGQRFPSSYSVSSRDDKGRWTERSIVENDTVVAIETREFRKIN